ncbi:dihydroorotate dehydrogenase electron transfer subunit [Puteibacter caeruleilacunae]|nr:dihydroorotate dehydrogenase electron transfer subunit [Puteibacter caeruleilacunae]
MKKSVKDLIILENECLNDDSHKIVFQAPDVDSDILPGQFANVLVKDSQTTFLRRPFSFYDVDVDEKSFSLIIKKVGDGTRKLCSVRPGEELSVIYPLGSGFTTPEKDEKVLLIGGGSGIAPMMLMAKKFAPQTSNIHILLGARSQKDHIVLDEFEKVGNLLLTTEDGSIGEKGYVTNHSIFKEISSFDKIYTCGPNPMMEAIGKIAKDNNIFCEVSLENTMGCGFGVCLCCVTPTQEGNKCVCTDGPVFNINELKW